MKIIKYVSLICAVWLVLFPVQAADTLNDKLGRIFSYFGSNASGSSEILEPDKAFIYSVEVIDPNNLKARWEIADGYYLYRDNFRFSIDQASVSPGQTIFPAGKIKEDPEFGDVEVYFHEVELLIPLSRQDLNEVSVNLTVVYQGCKDGEICYPPIDKTVPLFLPVASKSESRAAFQVSENSNPQQMISAQDAISNSLERDNMLVSMLVFFGFGLLLAFTPCIFPMIPILSGIIIGQNNITPYRAFLLSLAYVIAMALTYAVLGIIAGSFQFNIQAASQNVWILGTFSLVFVLLALSMFGFYELQLPVGWQERITALSNKQQRGNIVGAGIMGMLSAIVVGPCVAPPLAGALIYISQTGNAVLGGLALFALGLGMGVPLLVIGTSAGKLLPRAGNWMTVIKQIFGVVLLGVAIWLIGRVLPANFTMTLWGALLIVSSLYMGVFDKTTIEANWRKLWKGAGIVFLVYGITLVVGAASGSQDVFRPLQGIGSQTSDTGHLPFRMIKSNTDLDRILDKAYEQQRIVMLDFYADWCVTCKEMERKTFSNLEVQETLADLVLLKADVTANDLVDQELLHQFGIFGPPATLFFVKGQERREFRLVGYVKAADFTAHVKKLKKL